MRERMIEANEATLCTEAVGDPGDPPILLMMGMGASMLWWEDVFCLRLADAGRFVIRYDHRDTGADEASVRDYLVDYGRVLWGAERRFDEAHILDLVQRDIERANDPAAAPNHGLLDDDDESAERGPLRSITAATLVIHGTADPMFPLAHAEALAAEIPGARLLALDGAGHCVDAADWEVVTDAILDHTRGGMAPGR
jgi:pimeloyl-ACP methyl ester carboxylesterase